MKPNGAAAVFVLLAALVLPAKAAYLSLSPILATGAVGSQLVYNVDVTDLAPGQAVAAFDLDVVFNPALLAPASVTFGTALGLVDVDQFAISVFDVGRIDFAAVSLLDGASLLSLQGDAVTLAQIVFDAIAVGSTGVGFDASSLPGLLLGDADGNAISVIGATDASASVTGNVVPEPATALLMLLAAPGLWLTRKRAPFRRVAAGSFDRAAPGPPDLP